jgi:hypothetical protein
MSGTDVVPYFITGGGVVVGAITGGLIGALSSRTAIRASRKDARDNRRRDAYTAFIGAQEELTRAVFDWETADPPPESDSLWGPAIAQAVGSVDRALVAVLLAGPSEAQERARGVRDRASDIYRAIYRPAEPGEPVMPELGARMKRYAEACDQFTQTASKVLGA